MCFLRSCQWNTIYKLLCSSDFSNMKYVTTITITYELYIIIHNLLKTRTYTFYVDFT